MVMCGTFNNTQRERERERERDKRQEFEVQRPTISVHDNKHEGR